MSLCCLRLARNPQTAHPVSASGCEKALHHPDLLLVIGKTIGEKACSRFVTRRLGGRESGSHRARGDLIIGNKFTQRFQRRRDPVVFPDFGELRLARKVVNVVELGQAAAASTR
jgi:hypothetical protein